MENLNYPLVACVGIPTHEMFEYLKHINSDPRSYSVLDSWARGTQTQEDLDNLYNYVMNNPIVNISVKHALQDNRNDTNAFAQAISNSPDDIKSFFRCFHNFYYDSFDNIKLVLQNAVTLLPYPLCGTKDIDFDYYLILEQDPRTLEQFESNPILKVMLEEVNRRTAEVLSTIDATDKVKRVQIQYGVHDSEELVSSPPETLEAILDACKEFALDFQSKKDLA